MYKWKWFCLHQDLNPNPYEAKTDTLPTELMMIHNSQWSYVYLLVQALYVHNEMHMLLYMCIPELTDYRQIGECCTWCVRQTGRNFVIYATHVAEHNWTAYTNIYK